MKLGQIAISVKDVVGATRFYRDVLGLQFLFEFPGLAFFDLDGVRLMLTTPSKPEFDHSASILYFRVDDIRARHAELRSKGVAFDDAPHLVAKLPTHDLWMTFFRDPERNVLALMSEIEPA